MTEIETGEKQKQRQGLLGRVGNLIKGMVEKSKARDEAFRAKAAAQREADEKNSFFDIWHKEGTVYGASKYQSRHGTIVTTNTTFFISTPKGDHEIKLLGYDLPIANGQKVSIAYARGAQNKSLSGFAVRYVNRNLSKAIDLNEMHKNVYKAASGRIPGGVERLKKELDRFYGMR